MVLCVLKCYWRLSKAHEVPAPEALAARGSAFAFELISLTTASAVLVACVTLALVTLLGICRQMRSSSIFLTLTKVWKSACVIGCVTLGFLRAGCPASWLSWPALVPVAP